MRSLTKKLNEMIHISGRVVNMEELEKKCGEIIGRYYKRDIRKVTVRLFISIRKKYLYLSRYQVLGVDRKTNKWVRLNTGIGPIVRYAVAYWKYEHAREKEIDWNVITFSYDGYDLDVEDSRFDPDVDRRARLDARDGIVTRNSRALMQFLNRATVGSMKPHVDKDDEESDNI